MAVSVDPPSGMKRKSCQGAEYSRRLFKAQKVPVSPTFAVQPVDSEQGVELSSFHSKTLLLLFSSSARHITLPSKQSRFSSTDKE